MARLLLQTIKKFAAKLSNLTSSKLAFETLKYALMGR